MSRRFPFNSRNKERKINMFVVVFEVHPAPGKKDEYLGLAKHLRPILESIDGFIDNQRFESKRREGWVLSLSTWRDEKAWSAGAARASTIGFRSEAATASSPTI